MEYLQPHFNNNKHNSNNNHNNVQHRQQQPQNTRVQHNREYKYQQPTISILPTPITTPIGSQMNIFMNLNQNLHANTHNNFNFNINSNVNSQSSSMASVSFSNNNNNNNDSVRQRQALTQKLLINQTQRIIKQFRNIVNRNYQHQINNNTNSNNNTNGKAGMKNQKQQITLLDIYQRFYTKLYEQIEQNYIKVYEKQLMENRINAQNVLISFMKHFKLASQYFGHEFAKPNFNMKINSQCASSSVLHTLPSHSSQYSKNQLFCTHCSHLLTSRTIQLQKLKIYHHQFNDPFNYYIQGYMKFQQDIDDSDQQNGKQQIQSQCLDNQRQVYAYIHKIKERIQNRIQEIGQFLNQIQKYTNNAVKNNKKLGNNNKQQQVNTFDTVFKSMLDMLQIKIMEVFKRIKLQRINNPSKKSQYVQVGYGITQFQKLQRQRDKLLKINQQNQIQTKRLRNLLQTLQARTQKCVLQLEMAKYKYKQSLQQTCRTKADLQNQRTRSRNLSRRFQQKQLQAQSLSFQVRTLKQKIQNLQADLQKQRNGAFETSAVKRSTIKKKSLQAQQKQKSKINNSNNGKIKNNENADPNIPQNGNNTENTNGIKLQLPKLLQKSNTTKRISGNLTNRQSQNSLSLLQNLSTSRTGDTSNNNTNKKRKKMTKFYDRGELEQTANNDQIKQQQISEQCQNFNQYTITQCQQNNHNSNAVQTPYFQQPAQQASQQQNQQIKAQKGDNTQKDQNINKNNKSLMMGRLERVTAPVRNLNSKKYKNDQANDLIQQEQQNYNRRNSINNNNIRKIQSKQLLKNTKSTFRLSKNNIFPTAHQSSQTSNIQNNIKQIYQKFQQSMPISNPYLFASLSQRSAQNFSSTLPSKLKTKSAQNQFINGNSSQVQSLFTQEDVINLYFCIQGAIQHQKSKKLPKQIIVQLLKTTQYKSVTKILALLANIHALDIKTYQQVKNLLLFPFQATISQQNYYTLRYTTNNFNNNNNNINNNNEIKIKQALIKIIILHRGCDKNNVKEKQNKICVHLNNFINKLEDICLGCMSNCEKSQQHQQVRQNQNNNIYKSSNFKINSNKINTIQ